MFNIKRRQIDTLSKECDSKIKKGKENPDIYEEYIKSMWNKRDLIDTYSEYEMCHWTNFSDRYIKNRENKNIKSYKRGDIVFVDLGAVNFGFEPSFTHPCVVLKNDYNLIFVVPCSSKKYGTGFPEIIDAEISDGFAKPTGLQMNAIRFISKNRIISNTGSKVSSRILNLVDDYLLELNVKYNIQVRNNEKDLEKLMAENERLKKEISDLQKKINK